MQGTTMRIMQLYCLLLFSTIMPSIHQQVVNDLHPCAEFFFSLQLNFPQRSNPSLRITYLIMIPIMIEPRRSLQKLKI